MKAGVILLDKFDEMIKNKIANEVWEVPLSLDESLEGVFENLAQVKKRRSIPIRILIAVAVTTILTITTAVAANSDTVQNAINTVKNYFDSNVESKYISSKESLEKLNDEVGATVEDKGIKVTLESIAMDENFLNIFYKIESKEPIKRSEKSDEKMWDSTFFAPVGCYEIDGQLLSNADSEGHFESEHVFRTMTRIKLNNVETKENSKLKIMITNVLNMSGKWNMEINLEKNKLKTSIKSVKPNKNEL